MFVLEISERSSRRSTSSTFRHRGVELEVNNKNKDEDKDTAAPCTLLMLFECWVSLKHPLALYLSMIKFYRVHLLLRVSWRNEMSRSSGLQAQPTPSIDSGKPVNGSCSSIIIFVLLIILWIDTARRCHRHIVVLLQKNWETARSSVWSISARDYITFK